MGTPANGYRKPYIPLRPAGEPMTVRKAVEKYGDDCRLFLADRHGLRKQYQETATFDALEGIDMIHMERGLKSRVE